MQLPVNRAFAGGRGPSPNIWGPMFVIEAVGGDRFPPKVEPGPDPSGVQSLQLAWTLCPARRHDQNLRRGPSGGSHG